MAIYEDTVVVSAVEDNNYVDKTGYVFQRSNGNEWIHRAKLLAQDRTAGDEFGSSVSIYQDTIVVCSSEDDDNSNDSGLAYVFAPFE